MLVSLESTFTSSKNVSQPWKFNTFNLYIIHLVKEDGKKVGFDVYNEVLQAAVSQPNNVSPRIAVLQLQEGYSSFTQFGMKAVHDSLNIKSSFSFPFLR